ncbi:MAG TPA: lysozyme inhibitor LprI family protein [Burkholderiales bacterium]|nr:lysozyme inhibitor LprI family protein [Burkholderiales bacterium]
MRVLLLVAAFMAANAYAQYRGPAVESCRAYAIKEMKANGNQAKDVVFERDRNLLIERYTRKVGNQFVSSVLTGNGAVVLSGAPSAELSFLCLLADEKRPVFFTWLPRQDAVALAQCTRDDSLRTKSGPCLETLLQVAEAELGQLYATRFQEAHERGEAALVAYRKSNDEWRQYRDAECQRRRDTGATGDADERQLACIVDLTRRRALDMR